MDREQFRKAAYAAIDRVCDYYEQLESLPVMPDVKPGDTSKLLPETAPVKGEKWDDIAADFDKVILPGITHWQHPKFLAYFPANTNYESILADIYAGAISNPGFNWLCSPACTELEVRMMDWVAQMIGLDKSFLNTSALGGGVMNGSASESCLTAMIAARERAKRVLPDVSLSKFVLLATTQTHSLGAKAAQILGLKFRAIETRQENDWALRGAELEDALTQAKEDGLVPFALIATLGSTSTGAIDNIAEITAVTANHPALFLHVDAAWGGVYLSLPEARDEAMLDAINRRSAAHNAEGGICASGEVHSFCTNLHKAGLVMFDASCLWVRDRALLTEALDVTPPFLRSRFTGNVAAPDHRNWSLALGRRFRSLKVFFVLRSYGIAGFQAHLRKTIALGEYFEQLVRAHPDRFEMFTERRWALVVFRLVGPPASTDEETELLNKTFFAKIHERPDFHLTPTTVGGKSCTRVAIGGPHTEARHLDEVWQVVLEVEQWAREELTKAKQTNGVNGADGFNGVSGTDGVNGAKKD